MSCILYFISVKKCLRTLKCKTIIASSARTKKNLVIERLNVKKNERLTLEKTSLNSIKTCCHSKLNILTKDLNQKIQKGNYLKKQNRIKTLISTPKIIKGKISLYDRAL